MIPRLRRAPPEGVAALLCAAACLVPWARVPAGLLLLCVLPGLAFTRGWLGERSFVRALAMSGVFSLILVPLVSIPVALLAGQPVVALTALAAAAIALLSGPRRAQAEASRRVTPGRGPRIAVVFLLAAALAMQIAASFAIHPDGATLRWRGAPDHYFFQGIYTQTALQTPPLDPENGASRLLHNWIYHFHFAQIAELTDLPITAMQRVVSAWQAMTLLGLVLLIATDLMKSPAAGCIATLILMTASEARWLVRMVSDGPPDEMTLGWRHAPFGVILLIGWYNIAPIAALAAAWYLFERHRGGSSPRALWGSILCCAAAAFFHPVLFAVFMAGFVPYLGWLAWHGERARERLLYLASPLPFALAYVLPYYGLDLPPSVVHVDLTLPRLAAQGRMLLLHAGALLPAALGGLLAARGGGALVFLLAATTLLTLALGVPNAHWTLDLLSLGLALGAGFGLARLWSMAARFGRPVVIALLLPGAIAFGLHGRIALDGGYRFSEDELAAAAWLESSSHPDALVAVLPNSTATYPVLGFARRRLIHGWTTHQLDFHADALEREERARELITTADPERARRVAHEEGVRYIWLGPETAAIGAGGGLLAPCFPAVFETATVTLRSFACGGRSW